MTPQFQETATHPAAAQPVSHEMQYRIPHGYAYWYMGLDDPEWEEGQAPHEIGRAKFGRISIANSDSEATPLMDAAFNAAFRAVEEQT
jgi:spermidine dehydrogenase